MHIHDHSGELEAIKMSTPTPGQYTLEMNGLEDAGSSRRRHRPNRARHAQPAATNSAQHDLFALDAVAVPARIGAADIAAPVTVMPLPDDTHHTTAADGSDSSSPTSDETAGPLMAASTARAATIAASEPTPDEAGATSDITLNNAALPTNFAEALAMIERSGKFDRKQLAKLRSYVNTTARAVQDNTRSLDPARLPCAPKALRELLLGIYPARIGVTERNWADVKSGLHRILRATGCLQRRPRRHRLSPAWQAVLFQEGDLKFSSFALTRFAGFCTTKDIEPVQVTDPTFDAFREYVETSSLLLDSRNWLSSLKGAWRRLCREHPEFGLPPLEQRPRYNLVATRTAELPASFHTSVAAYLARCAVPDPLDPDCGRPLAPETLRKRRGLIFLGAQYLLDLGWPAERLDHLRAICSPEAIGAILREQFRRHSRDGRTWPAGAKPMASHFLTMATRIGQLGDADLAEIRKFARHVPGPKRGFPKQTRERLAVFDDERVLRDFYRLPQTLWTEARGFEKAGRLRRAAAKAKAAIALAILLTKPLRIGELASLDFTSNFRRDRKGRIIGLCIPGERTKTGVPIEAAIDAALGKKIAEYFDRFVRPVCNSGRSFLFASGSGGHIAGRNLAQSLTREVRHRLGIKFNPHLVRALVTTLILDIDPNGGAIAQRMLEHTKIETTLAHYGMQRGRAAQRLYEHYLARALRGRTP